MNTFIIFELIFGAVMFTAIIGIVIAYNVKNKRSPKLSVEATVVTKRTARRRKSADTYYFATFQFNSGDRMEFWISHIDYDELGEDDRGILTFQGRQFIGFVKDELKSAEAAIDRELLVTDVISFVSEEEISSRELEQIFIEHMNGTYSGEYNMQLSMPWNADDRVLDNEQYLRELGRKVAYILKNDEIIAVIGYKK